VKIILIEKKMKMIWKVKITWDDFSKFISCEDAMKGFASVSSNEHEKHMEEWDMTLVSSMLKWDTTGESESRLAYTGIYEYISFIYIYIYNDLYTYMYTRLAISLSLSSLCRFLRETWPVKTKHDWRTFHTKSKPSTPHICMYKSLYIEQGGFLWKTH